MKKRQLFLRFLERILIGKQPAAQDPISFTSDQSAAVSGSGIDEIPAASQPPNPSRGPEPSLTASDLPAISEEIKELLGSADWDEVNQGLELLAASCGAEQIKAFGHLIDASSLSIRNQSVWQTVLGINENNALNAVAKLAGLSGALNAINSVQLNSANYAGPEIQLNLDSLAGASHLQELVINGIELSGLGALSSFSELGKLVLVSGSNGSLDWDSEDDAECFLGLKKLRFLTVSNWPWEDLQPLSACTGLEHLDLRGGELESLLGVDRFSGLRFLALSDFYSLSCLDGLDQLTQLRHLSLSGLSVDTVEQVGRLQDLQTFAMEASEDIDLSPLGQLSSLRTVHLNCDEATGVGSLALCPELHRVHLGSIPTYKIGESGTSSFGSSEFSKLMTAWKALSTPSKKVCNNCAEANDLGVFLLGLNLLESLSAQIDIAQLRTRLDEIASRYGHQLSSRCYWPQAKGSVDSYPLSHPVGIMMQRALTAGCLDREGCHALSALLAERLPKVPVR